MNELPEPGAAAVTGTAGRPILVMANGNGEDAIAAEMIKRLPVGTTVEAWPMIGTGKAYDGICDTVGPRAMVPSEGWRHTSGNLKRDVKGGALGAILPGIRFLKSARGRYAKVVAVGDGVSPLLCFLAGLPIDIYLDVFKSGYAHTYNGFERFVLKRTATTVFCRDDMLAETLMQAGIDGRSAGNVMLDTVPHGSYDMAARRSHKLAVTLLPGSRATTGESLKTQISAIMRVPQNLRPDVFVALAGGIDPGDLADETGMTLFGPTGTEKSDRGALVGHGLHLHLAQGVLGNLIEGSDLVLSQAGTATQQALGLGKPVITFDRADNRRKRMQDEQKLMGESRILTPPGIQPLADALVRLLQDDAERQRRGAIGPRRLGGPGTLEAVIRELTV